MSEIPFHRDGETSTKPAAGVMTAPEAAGPLVDRHEHVRRIAAAWQHTVCNVIETGRLLIEAKDDIGFGGFQEMIRRAELPFGPRTAQRLMQIAEDRVLSNTTHASYLPASWMTLYELAKLPKHGLDLEVLIEEGTIHPKMERKDVRALLPAPERDDDLPPGYEGSAEPEDEAVDDADTPEASADARKAQYAAEDANIADPDNFLTDEGDYAPADLEADAACRIRGFLYRAQQSAFAAQTDSLKNLACTKEMLVAAQEATKAWAEVCNLASKAHRPHKRDPSVEVTCEVTEADGSRLKVTAEEISRFAYKLIQLDIGLARELVHILQARGATRLMFDLETVAAAVEQPKRKRGRPKGSKNKPKALAHDQFATGP
jgi:hypothetical protein